MWQTPNQLLKAVSADLSVREYVDGLGIVNKVITGPLWRVLECREITILNMNQRFRTLNDWSVNASSVVAGEAVVFDIFPPSVDSIHASLFAELLCVLFSAFSSLLHLVEDHLSERKFDNVDETLIRDTMPVPKMNTVSERDFAQLDCLLREKLNASILSLEAMILFSNNKTAKRLSEKSQAEWSKLLQKARSCGPELKDLYQACKKRLLEWADILQAKQAVLMHLQEKKVREKEKLTQTMMIYGLWQNEQQMQADLMKPMTKTSKLQALKPQLDFRKILEQNPVDKSIFLSFNKQKKKLSVDEVCTNLCKLFPPTSGLIGNTIKHKWNVDGTEKWYFGTILDVVAGTNAGADLGFFEWWGCNSNVHVKF